jgi:hypothetical protein
VWVVIIANGVWTADSFLLLVSGWVAPNRLGEAFVTVQAGAVAVLMVLEYVTLRGPSGVFA